MSISPLITGGFGSFSGVQFLPTLGFGLGAANENTDQEAGAPSVSKPSKYPRRYIYKDETYIVHDEREEYELERMVADDLASAQAQPVSPKRQSKINKQAKRVLKVARMADFVMEPLPYEVEGMRMLPAMQAITPTDLDSMTEEDEMMILMMMAA